MSVVHEAVNSFFGHPSNHHPHTAPFRDTPVTSTPNQRRSRTPSRPTEPHMSASGQRASSSSETRTVPPREHTSSTESRTTPTPQRHGAPQQQPASPPLAAQAAPPHEHPQSYSRKSNAPSGGASTDDARSGRSRKIRVRDLEHIQSFATDDMGAFSEGSSRSQSRARGGEDSPQYEISDMKVEHIIEMVAGLLTKITTTNDQQHEHLHRQPPSAEAASQMNQQTSSVLAFHGKNVPSITILSYLSRIHKYCPTSYEVFLSLLVYFDRMTERVNAGPMETLRQASQHGVGQNSTASSSTESLGSEEMEGIAATTPSGTQQATPPHSGELEKGVPFAVPGTPHSKPQGAESPGIPPEPALLDPYNLSHFFVVDSFNIHRLVIAGVTCASKFFSDIFYTNSRYAKVCFLSPYHSF